MVPIISYNYSENFAIYGESPLATKIYNVIDILNSKII